MLIRTRLILLTVLPVALSTLVITVILVFVSRTALLKESFEHQKTLADRLAWGFYENHFTRIEDSLLYERYFFHETAGTGRQTTDITLQERYLKDLFRKIPALIQISVLNTSGFEVIKLMRDNDAVAPLYDFADESGSRGFIVASKNRTYISPAFQQQGANCVEIFTPILDAGGSVKEILKARINLKAVMDKVSGGLPKGFTVYLVDNRGNLIAHPGYPATDRAVNLSNLLIIRDFLSGRPSGFDEAHVYKNLQDEKVFGVYAPIPKMGYAVVLERPADDIYRAADITLVLGAGVALCFLAGFVSWGVLSARTIARSMQKLLKGAEIVGTGNLEHRTGIDTKDETGQLSSAFDKMTQQLKEQRDKLEEQTKQLETQRSYLEKLTDDLYASNKELEAFSYSISHDLRAPLRSIDGFSMAVLEDYADRLDEQGRNYLQRLRAASQRMAQLIDDILKLSRITRGQLRLERVNLSAVAKSVAAELQESQPERKVEFVIAEGTEVQGDAGMLRALLANLLGNAWKFTGKHPHARIEFGIMEHEGRPAYFVRDDGAGFDMAHADKLFSAFQRLHTTTEFEGTGIGLATVQRIIHKHGGRIWAEGVVEKGATFYFTL